MAASYGGVAADARAENSGKDLARRKIRISEVRARRGHVFVGGGGGGGVGTEKRSAPSAGKLRALNGVVRRKVF